MRRWQRRRGHRAEARMASVVLVVALMLAAASVAGCAQQTSTPTPTLHAPVDTPTDAAASMRATTPVAVLPGALHLTSTVTHLTPTVTWTPSGTFTQFKLPHPPGYPFTVLPAGLAASPDGTMWFGEVGSGVIGSLTPSGTLVTYTLPPDSAQWPPNPEDVAWGPDGALWFTLVSGDAKVPDRIGRLTPAGALNQFPLPASYFGPSAILAGADGGLWFLEAGPNGGAIGRSSTSGAITEFFPVPLAQESGLYGLVAGPDGALWFTTMFEVGRLSPTGTSRLFAVPNDRPNDSAAGAGLASGPDGALWFVEPRANRIGRLTPAGAFSSFAVPTAAAYPLAICTGHDGNLWFTERLTSKLGRLTPLGVITEIAVPLPQKLLAGGDDLTQIAAGSGGAIWFIEEQVDQIGFLA